MSLLMINILVVFTLSGCATPKEPDPIPKTVIQIKTQPIHNADNTWYISKSARVQGTSEIVVTSQIAGRVDSFWYRIGDQVKKDAILVWLKDTAGSISFGAKKSEIAAQIAQTNYDIQQQSLAKQVQDAKLNLEKATISQEALRKDSLRQKEKLNYDLDNTNALLSGSTTQIQLQKLETDLAKVEFDYQSKLKSDEQTNENLITSARNIQSDLQILLTDTVDQTDRILWVTDTYLNDQDYKDMRIYIWAKDTSIKNKAIEVKASPKNQPKKPFGGTNAEIAHIMNKTIGLNHILIDFKPRLFI